MGSLYEYHFDDDVDYYDGDIEDDVEAKGKAIEDDVEFEDEDVGDDAEAEDEDVEEDVEVEGEDYDECSYERPSDWSCITNASSKLGLRYEKHGKEILELGFHNS